MKTKKSLFALLAVIPLTACGGGVDYGAPFVTGGEKYNATMLDTVPSEVKEAKTASIKGVKIEGTSEVSGYVKSSYAGESQKQSISSSSKVIETFDFVNKTLEMNVRSDEGNYKYKIQLTDTGVVLSYSTGIDADTILAEFTSSALADLFEMSFDTCFSWKFIPNPDEIKEMGQTMTNMFNEMGLSVTVSGLEEYVQSMVDSYYISGDYQNGNFEVGFKEGISGALAMDMYGSTTTVNLVANRMRAKYQDYLLQESVSGIEESMVMNMSGYAIEMKMNCVNYSSFSYIY